MSGPREVTVSAVQELADSLVYRLAEGRTFGRDYEYHVGLVAGWNSALRMVAEDLGGTIETKPLDQRVRYVGCPDGHDVWEWTGPDRKMGTYRCACGHEKRCYRRNAEERHAQHRTSEAWDSMRAERAS
jgi:hypothetical protein